MNLTSEEIEAFKKRSSAIFDEAEKRALELAANTVQVIPGGATFNNIKDAIDSIHNAGPQLEYQVIIGPGTYNEQINTKDYIFIVGAGIKTIIKQNGYTGFGGAVQAMGNGGISNMEIFCTANAKGTTCAGIHMMSPGRYHARMVKVYASDEKYENVDSCGITNKAGGSTGFVLINNCTMAAAASGKGSGAAAIDGNISGFSYMIEECSIYAKGGTGIKTSLGATVTVNSSTVEGQNYALYDTDEISIITANGCTIVGKVSKGVIVNP
jgi:hypothetical protein